MRVKLLFDLPEDRDELRYAQRGQDYAAAIEELQRWLRAVRKHGDQPDDYQRAVEDIEEMLSSALADRDLTWDL